MINQRIRLVAVTICTLLLSAGSLHSMANKMELKFNFNKEDKRDLFDAALCLTPLVATGLVAGATELQLAYAKANAAYDPYNYKNQEKVRILEQDKQVLYRKILPVSAIIGYAGYLYATISMARRDFWNGLSTTPTNLTQAPQLASAFASWI